MMLRLKRRSRFRQLFAVSLVMAGLISACGKTNDKRQEGGGGGSGTGTITDPGGTGTASTLEFGPFPAEVYTSETAENACVTFTIYSKANAAAVADVGVILSVVSNSPSTAEEKGKVTPESAVTNEQGELEVSYCSGKAEGLVTVVAKAGSISANSSQITIKKKPAYTFVYTGSDTPVGKAEGDEGPSFINLNTIDSGPQDCTYLYFTLQKSGAPVVGAQVTFATQTDFPKGVKLQKRADPLVTELDPVNGKKMAAFDAVSSTTGGFAVPICTGSSLGSVTVTGIFTDPDEGRRLTVSAPVIRITSGTTSYINYSLSFDPINARTLRAFYNTNSEYDLPLKVQTGARVDGLAISDYPVTIATEVGRYTMAGGYPDPVSGEVPFSLHALHAVDNYPYPVIRFWRNQAAGTIYSSAQTRCDPQEIATWVRAANGGTALRYSELKKNWQSTLVYAIRGQEYFHDANRNGIYDEGGMGFWDKNQNGVYDGNDVITFPAGATNFDPTGEWFIDMPTPFIDVDEDLLTSTTGFNPAIDMLLGDEYIAPNGKRDSDTVVWKNEIFPISMGPSGFSLTNDIIRDDGAGTLSPILELVSANSLTTVQDDLRIFSKGPMTAAKMWDTASPLQIGIGLYNFQIFLQDLCGNLLPGGTKIAVTFEEIYKGTYGDRKPLAFLYGPAIDNYLEPTRNLLKTVSGAQAEINFNSSNHPSASAGYPLSGRVEVSSCDTPCTGLVDVPGVACDAWTGYVNLTLEAPKLDQHTETTTLRSLLVVPAVKSCECSLATGVIFEGGQCKCPDGTELDPTTPPGECVKAT